MPAIPTQVFTKITQNSPPLSFYPAAQRVTYLYYLGRFHFINNHFRRAARCLQEAYLQTPARFQKHRTQILTYLIPCNLLLGRLPSEQLLARPEARAQLAPVFVPLARAVRAGSFPGLQRAVAAHEGWLLRKGLLLTLTYRLRALVWRSFTRRVFLLTYAPSADDADAGGAIDQETDSRKAATLELEHLLVAAQFVQRRLEGWYVPPSPHINNHNHKGRQGSGSGINPMLLKAIINNNSRAAEQSHGDSSTSTTLVPPPRGPKVLRPDEGLVWGNMPITAEHIEAVVAGLVAQGLLNGFVAHAQARFAVIGARAKGSAVAAGWPVVADVTVGHDRAENEPVPGWVRDRDV
ncbi:hypothetical protein SLS62_002548 [Diatrype stigma]|uniref:PCI domain-containing protein n=1 Tax=Diatrype stigma TaxID=117547 RepID=A0AAN9YV06_9PEZI